MDKDCEDFVVKTINHFDRLDVLVNNAGIPGRNSLETLCLDQHDRVMNVNSRSVLLLMKLCVPYLIQSKGNVVNVASFLGITAVGYSLFSINYKCTYSL